MGIFNGYHTFGNTIYIIISSFRHDSLTGTKDMAPIIRFVLIDSNIVMIHLHVIRTDFCIAKDFDDTFTTGVVCQYIRHIYFYTVCCSFFIRFSHLISGYGSNLATAIDAVSHLGITLNDDSRVTTNQSRVAMCLLTLTATEYATFDFRCTGRCAIRCHTISNAYRHHGILFYTAYLTAAVDITIYRSVTDGDVRSTIRIIYAITIFSDHGLLT